MPTTDLPLLPMRPAEGQPGARAKQPEEITRAEEGILAEAGTTASGLRAPRRRSLGRDPGGRKASHGREQAFTKAPQQAWRQQRVHYRISTIRSDLYTRACTDVISRREPRACGPVFAGATST